MASCGEGHPQTSAQTAGVLLRCCVAARTGFRRRSRGGLDVSDHSRSGPTPVTQDAADAALDVIDFIAAAVRGYDAIDVTSIVRPIWRSHLAYWYPQLPPPTQLWFANAPHLLPRRVMPDIPT